MCPSTALTSGSGLPRYLSALPLVLLFPSVAGSNAVATVPFLTDRQVAEVFRDEWAPSIREIVMGNVIEQWVAYIAGPLAVPGFLRKCVNP